MAFKFPVINPLLHNELRLKIMVALDSLESANFMYLCEITGSTRGNLSVQIKTLQEAGYLQVDKSGPPPVPSAASLTRALTPFVPMSMGCVGSSKSVFPIWRRKSQSGDYFSAYYVTMG